METNTAPWGHLTDKSKMTACKVRIAQSMRVTNPDGTPERSVDIMNQMKLLTDADISDFARWFEEAGYLTIGSVASA